MVLHSSDKSPAPSVGSSSNIPDLEEVLVGVWRQAVDGAKSVEIDGKKFNTFSNSLSNLKEDIRWNLSRCLQ
jgi:hypothetical protein